jgi:hypothetical protein
MNALSATALLLLKQLDQHAAQQSVLLHRAWSWAHMYSTVLQQNKE